MAVEPSTENLTTEITDDAPPRFEDLGIRDETLEIIRSLGWITPRPIQSGVIPFAEQGRDVIGLAQTGSGKTAAFAIPIVEKVHISKKPQAVILSPTREVALQTEEVFRALGEARGLRVVALIGGVRFGPQLDGLKRGPQIVIATPGRLLDHMERGTMSADEVRFLVLDEADHMLDLGFMPQVRKVLHRIPRHRQTMMFSATMPPEIEVLARSILRDPELVDIRPLGHTAEGIEHQLYLVYPQDKREALLKVLEAEEGSTIVFARRKVDAEWLFHILEKKGHEVARIHSDRSQSHRTSALDSFRSGSRRILVATDIAGRGIDIPIVAHVINFDPPATVDDYVHRAGRTARGDAGGTVSTIATWQEMPLIQEVERKIGQTIHRGSIPGIREWKQLGTGPRRSRRRV
jgi:ATP-dependent RNA helicase RhlE